MRRPSEPSQLKEQGLGPQHFHVATQEAKLILGAAYADSAIPAQEQPIQKSGAVVTVLAALFDCDHRMQ